MKMLDLGEILRVVCVEPGPLNGCVIEIVGESGSRRYDTEVVLSRNRFEQEDDVRFWNVRTECLLAQWQEMDRDTGRDHLTLPTWSKGEKIKLPSTLEAMQWAKKSVKESLGCGDGFYLLQGSGVEWVNADGELVNEPRWFAPMFALYLIYGFQNEYANQNSHGDHFERMHDEYVLLKLVLDAYAKRLSPNVINGETFEEMAFVCEELRSLMKDFNRDVKSGTLKRNHLEWSRRLDAFASRFGEYNYREVHCDFDEAMRDAVEKCKVQLQSDNPQCVEIAKRYTPFRYPGTQIVTDVW